MFYVFFVFFSHFFLKKFLVLVKLQCCLSTHFYWPINSFCVFFYSTFGHTAFLGVPKGPVLTQKGPFGGPRGLRATPGGLICVKLPLAGPTGWAASIPCARSPQETTKALLGPVFGPESHFWWPWRFSGSPGGPDLGPSATGWSNWVGRIQIMCSHPLRDLYNTPGAHKRAHFGP